jgi:hypothetical protein
LTSRPGLRAVSDVPPAADAHSGPVHARSGPESSARARSSSPGAGVSPSSVAAAAFARDVARRASKAWRPG